MLAKKCDRCGRLYVEDHLDDDELKINGVRVCSIGMGRVGNLGWPYDLCDECVKSLVRWWDNPGEEE